MASVSQSLTIDTWYQLSRSDTHPIVVLEIQGTGTVVGSPSAVPPIASSPGYLLPEGLHQILIAENKSFWVRLTSGTATVVWSDAVVSLVPVEVQTSSSIVSQPLLSVEVPP